MPQMGKRDGLLAAMLVLLVASLSGGCGRTAGAKADAGDGSLPPPDAIGPGRHAFDVVAVLRGDGGIGAGGLPTANNFTLVIDADALQAIVGGNGYGAVIGITSADGRTIRAAGPFSVGGASNPCSSTEYVTYEDLEVTIAGDSLTGTATGTASVSCGDCSFLVPFTATLTGSVDATPPLLHGFGPPPASPFDPFRLVASEPMPTSAAARLVAGDGTSIDLIPLIADGSVPLITGFSKPDVILRAGQAYTVALDGLVDFAGHTDRTGPPLGLTSFPAAPVVPEDGFESAGAGVLGGAMVMTGGPLPAIAGNTSLYAGTPGAPLLDSVKGLSLMVRLARQAGDTKLRFSFRVVTLRTETLFFGSLSVGSEGVAPSPVQSSFSAPGQGEVVTVGGTPISLSAVAQMEVPLPADTTDEVLVLVSSSNFSCGVRGLTGGVLIDDLRLE